MASETVRAPAPVEPNGACNWRCPEHSERLAELFCRRCGRCVCALCPVLGAHRGHPVGLAQEEAASVQKLIQDCSECLVTKKRQHADNIAHLEDTGERLQAYADSSKAWLTQKFTELRLLLDEEEVLAKKFIDKNTELTLQVYREQAESCRKQIEVMDDFSTRVWVISLEPNPIQLLQAYIATKSEMEQHMSPLELSHPVPLSFEPVKNFFKTFVEAIRDTLQTPMDTRLKQNINYQLSGSSSSKPGTLLKMSPSPERSLFLKCKTQEWEREGGWVGEEQKWRRDRK
ncbi:Trim14 [Phodopus roborovskii]|uniref:Trim14 protein n=1 Tax=Phodopus roborovskii TaxID=109678 RepID=A0AAU9ZGG0_PHORO|nr:Trim14 [Phodopus roborovskii]